MKIYTCALRPFNSNPYFFTRDSGLLCRSFQSIDVESKVLLPAASGNDEYPCEDVIRVKENNLTSSRWWKSLEIDGVAIVTWGHREDTPVVKAAKESGIQVILVTDDSEGKRIAALDILRDTWRRLYHKPLYRRILETSFKFPLLYIWLIWKKSGRLNQYRYADMITCWTERIGNNVRNGLESKYPDSKPIYFFGYPSSDISTEIPGKPTEDFVPQIIAVAKWTEIKHKRPHFLIDVCREILRRNPTTIIHIYGHLIPHMTDTVAKFPVDSRHRILLHGFSDNQRILECMSQCQIAICPSANDCGPVPMAEALCRGCTIVGNGNVAQWAAEMKYGTSCADDCPESFAASVTEEISKWERSFYDRQENIRFWQRHYSAKQFAKGIHDFVADGLRSL